MGSVKLFTRQATGGEALVVGIYVKVRGWKSPVRKSLNVQVDPAKWDQGKQRVKGRGEDVERVNLLLQNKVSQAVKIITDFELMKKPLSRSQFLLELESPTVRLDFLDFMERKMEENYERRSISKATLLQERRTLRRLRNCHPEGLLFSEISRDWLEGFDRTVAKEMAATGHSGEREREKALKYIRKYLNHARQALEGGERIRDPFRGFKWPKYQSAPVWLEEEEVQKLWNLYENPDAIMAVLLQEGRRRGMVDWNLEQYANTGGVQRVRRTLRQFLWQCHTGMRYSDLERVASGWVIGDHIMWVPHKTRDTSGKSVKMLISPAMRRLIQAGEGKETIFRTISNQKYNDHLKEVATLADISKPLTTHVGRHTFATLSLRRGMHIETLQALMGLSKITTLMVYVHISQDRSDEEMRRAWGDF